MGFFSVLNRSNMQSGQPENIADIVANLDAIAAVVNGNIDNSNVNAAAALAISKLAGYPSDATKVLRGDGSWLAAGGGSSELDYAQITADVVGITATTEATATAVITGNSVTYDGSKVRLEFEAPQVIPTTTAAPVVTLVFFRDTTAIGQYKLQPNQISGGGPGSVPTTYVMYDTPPAGAHTYSVKMFVASAAVTVKAGAGGTGNLLPAFLRVTRDPAIGPQGAMGPQGPQGAGAVGAANVQTFTANGTWTKPSGMTVVKVIAVGQGGGGGGGPNKAATATQGNGGGGGGGGARLETTMRVADLPATVAVTVGNASTVGAGAAASSALAGSSGAIGANSSFGTYLVAGGGGGGQGGGTGATGAGGGSGGGAFGSGATGASSGTATGGGGGGVVGARAVGLAGGGGGVAGGAGPGGAEWGGGGGSGHGSAATPGASSMYGAGGGGGAGQIASNSPIASSPGGSSNSFTAGGGGAPGTSGNPPTNASPGASGNGTEVCGAGGGGGGNSSALTVAGSNGGNGGFPGGGGGGGGAGNSTGKGGDGGNGGGGLVVVICW